ncbi:hypothetical protein QJS04_geneDACA018338 [Acorus gramineus]|uniref:Uncharacterized protein n=1 Tax=Acorus gramineus TaxID=55184 RepID=A0AAV9BBL6_ACOGR|nr:hypothetical protein QJS04_geneDACA018338 [Acorus gramineus]
MSGALGRVVLARICDAIGKRSCPSDRGTSTRSATRRSIQTLAIERRGRGRRRALAGGGSLCLGGGRPSRDGTRRGRTHGGSASTVGSYK